MMNGTTKNGFYEEHPAVTSPPLSRTTNLDLFKKYVEEQHGLTFENYWQFHDWSTEHFPSFWGCIWNYFKVIHSVPYKQVFDRKTSFHNMKWFEGARLNYAENIFRYRDSHLALIATNEEGHVEKVTYRQMYEETAQYASALKALGVKTGDRVTCFMSNRKEAIIAYFATASIGAIWSGSLPYFGPDSVIRRLKQIEPKILFSVDRFVCEGQEVDMLSKLIEIEKGLPSVEKIIIVRAKQGCAENPPPLPKSCWLSDFLKLSADTELKFEQLPFDHPLIISYTSGTTGMPKALVHSAGSFLSALRDFGVHQNCTREDVMLSLSPVGWISWTLFVNSLLVGCTVCVYEGSPYYLSPTAFWDIVETFGISYVFLPASVIEDFRQKSYLPTAKHSLKSLRLLMGSCSPVKPQLYDFVKDVIIRPKNPDIRFFSLYGCTETMGCISGLNLNMPIHRGEIQMFVLGMDARCLDEQGNYVTGERGNLVLAKPIPSLPIYLYNDPDKKIFTESYLKTHPGHWDLNDEIVINPKTRGFIVLGRVDATMKPYGERFSSSDIYAVIDKIKEVQDCLCVSQKNDKMDERVVLFVKMAPGCKFSTDLQKRIRHSIAEDLTPEYVPSVILEAPEIPYNFSGKKMELLVKKLINKKSAANRDVLVNPNSISFYENLPQLMDY